jgi:hypothetical protein
MAAHLSLQPYPIQVCVSEEESNGVRVGRSVPSKSKCCRSLLFCMLYVRYMNLVLGGKILLSAQTTQYVGWIVLILSGTSFCVLLLDKHTWDFKSNYAVVFLGGLGLGTRGFMQTRQSKLLLCMCLVLTVL